MDIIIINKLYFYCIVEHNSVWCSESCRS